MIEILSELSFLTISNILKSKRKLSFEYNSIYNFPGKFLTGENI